MIFLTLKNNLTRQINKFTFLKVNIRNDILNSYVLIHVGYYSIAAGKLIKKYLNLLIENNVEVFAKTHITILNKFA